VRVCLLLIALPFLLGATLAWDPVTTDITGAPETPAGYRCYSRRVNTTEAWVQFGFAAHPATEIGIPVPAAKQEYAVTAVDQAGNESAFSEAAIGKLKPPPKPTVR
jgi:hypothetical protein